MKAEAAKIKQWRNDPVLFVKENFGVTLENWQAKFMKVYNENPRTLAKACKGPGKTAVEAFCSWHFLATRPFPKMAATSITGDNLRDNLWPEMSKWQERSPLLRAGFTWKAERIYANDHPEQWFMAARKWSRSASKEQQANALAGLHADYIMFVLDELGGIPDSVMIAAEGALSTGIECKIIGGGNPTHLSGPLYRACTVERSEWQIIEITGDPDDPDRSTRISVEWARKQIKSWGVNNPWVLVNVFGKFPPSSLNALVGPDDMSAAMRRHIPEGAYAKAVKVLGVDVARQGDDTTVLFPRQGIVMFKPKILRIPDLTQVAGHVANAIKAWNPDAVNVDQTGGFGAAVVDNLRNWGYPVNGIEAASSALDSSQFVNIRAESGWKFANWIKNGGALPDSPELTEEATKLTYFFKGDRIQLIEKAQLKEELKRSPDLWDAGALTHALPVAKRNLQGEAEKRAETEYNPVDRHFGGNSAANQSMDDWNPIG